MESFDDVLTLQDKHDVAKITEKGFRNLYPNRQYNYTVTATFSGRLGPYNATVSRFMGKLHFKMSKKWIGMNADIAQGLIEELLIKIIGGKNRESMYIDLYNNFIKNLHLSIPKTKNDPILEASFNRVNEKYFNNQIERPNLAFKGATRSKLGAYDYKTDTITMSTLFREHHDVLDYIMYHELLHKVLKFRHKGIRNHFHTAEFRRLERQFENQKQMEEKINVIVRESHKKSTQQKKQSHSFLRTLSEFW